jgi:hypothetical protein
VLDDIIIVDDAIPLDRQLEIEKICLSDSFGWIYHPTAAYGKEYLATHDLPDSFLDNAVESPLFTHLLWNQYGRNSHYCNDFFPIVDAIPAKFDRLLRFKINLTLPTKDTTIHTHSIPHVDFDIIDVNLITAIYYINDSDGDTVIFNERSNSPFENLTVKQRITPKRGRLVVFDSGYYHAGNNPGTNTPRLTANINLLPSRG